MLESCSTRPHYGAPARGKPTRPGSDTAVIVGRRARASVARQRQGGVPNYGAGDADPGQAAVSALFRSGLPTAECDGAALTLAEVDVSARCNADSTEVTDLCRSISRPMIEFRFIHVHDTLQRILVIIQKRNPPHSIPITSRLIKRKVQLCFFVSFHQPRHSAPVGLPGCDCRDGDGDGCGCSLSCDCCDV
jgi:hypothetical protein